jgi:hypothetical protein
MLAVIVRNVELPGQGLGFSIVLNGNFRLHRELGNSILVLSGNTLLRPLSQ